MSLEVAGKVEYEDGDHCIFYAVQDASIYFNQKPLTIEDRDALQRQRQRVPTLYKALTGITESRDAWLKLSLGIVMQKLNDNGIVPDIFTCTEETKGFLEDINFVKRQQIQFFTPEGGGRNRS